MRNMFVTLLIILGLAGLWDGFTTFYGSYSLLGGGGMSVIISMIFAVIITAFLFTTSFIWSRELQGEFIGDLLKGFWFIAFAFDVFTSFVGNKDILLSNVVELDESMIMLVGITALVSGSPIIFSYIITLAPDDRY